LGLSPHPPSRGLDLKPLAGGSWAKGKSLRNIEFIKLTFPLLIFGLECLSLSSSYEIASSTF
jgi:hypothetical protein